MKCWNLYGDGQTRAVFSGQQFHWSGISLEYFFKFSLFHNLLGLFLQKLHVNVPILPTFRRWTIKRKSLRFQESEDQPLAISERQEGKIVPYGCKHNWSIHFLLEKTGYLMDVILILNSTSALTSILVYLKLCICTVSTWGAFTCRYDFACHTLVGLKVKPLSPCMKPGWTEGKLHFPASVGIFLGFCL